MFDKIMVWGIALLCWVLFFLLIVYPIIATILSKRERNKHNLRKHDSRRKKQ